MIIETQTIWILESFIVIPNIIKNLVETTVDSRSGHLVPWLNLNHETDLKCKIQLPKFSALPQVLYSIIEFFQQKFNIFLDIFIVPIFVVHDSYQLK